MPRASFSPRSPAHLAASSFVAEEWRLVTKLPAEVMIATISLQDGGSRRTVAEGLAGLDAIAAGRGSDSDLVRAVVAAIYAEPEDDRPPPDHPAQPPQLDAGDPRARVLADCRRVVGILRAGADPADSAAYRHWVQQVAVRVCHASRSSGVLGVGADSGGVAAGDRISPLERQFLADLGGALS
jgi:hypothetical protein